jgi:hypothetical protein
MDDFRELARGPKFRRRFEKLLFLAAQRGDAEQVAQRLSWGIDPNCLSSGHRTPLIANVRGHSPRAATVLALLAAGADPRHSDQSGLIALDYARRKLMKIKSRRPRAPRKSPSLDENDQLALAPWEQAELDRLRDEFRPGEAREFLREYWKERLKVARRVFNDPIEIEKIVEILEAPGSGE